MEPVCYTLDANDRFERFNDRWDRFALENGAPELAAEQVRGRPLWDFIVDAETRRLYRNLLWVARNHGGAIRLPFRCDTPTLRRPMEMEIRPRAGERVEFRCTVLDEQPQDAVPDLPSADKARSTVTLCSMCRRVYGGPLGWLEMAEAVHRLAVFREGRLPSPLYTVCPVCQALADAAAPEHPPEN